MESNVDLNLLQTAILLCKLKNLKLVGLKLGKSESAVSKHISKLQTQLNEVLFERTPSGLQSTAYMRSILPQLEHALSIIDQALAPVTFSPQQYCEPLIIALPTTLLDLYNSDIYRLLKEEFPNAPITIKTWDTDTIENIESGVITFGVHYLNEETNSHIYQRTLIDDELVLVIADKHKESYWKEVKNWPFIKFLSSGWNDHRFHYLDKLEKLGITLEHSIEIDNAVFAWSLLQQEKCCFFIPKLSLRQNCKLVQIPNNMNYPLTLSANMRLTDRTNPLHQHLHKIFLNALKIG